MKTAQKTQAPSDEIAFPEVEKIHSIERAINDLKCAVQFDDGIEVRLRDNREALTLLGEGVARLKDYYSAERAINDLKRAVQFDDGIEARLRDNREALALLGRAIDRLKTYFPADTEYFLRATYDTNPNSKCVSLDIMTNCSYEESMAALDKFDDEWWLDNMPRRGDVLIIGVRFA